MLESRLTQAQFGNHIAHSLEFHKGKSRIVELAD
jgi:hypothetical protein